MSERKRIDKFKAAKIAASNDSGVVVFTNGCFDIIHEGHIDYLQKAAELGDTLIIGLNSDKSIRKIKGENRPILDYENRSRILAALEFVSYVVPFDEETPETLIKTIKPDILAKGADYEISEIVGADFVMKNGGKVERIPFVEGLSTSKIIQTIIERYCEN